LGAASELGVPEVLVVDDDPPLLVLSWVDETGGGSVDDAAFGRGLAALHSAGAERFGRDDARTTGSRAMPNDTAETWPAFYGERRLRYLARLAADANALSAATVSAIEELADRLDQLVGPAEPPARLHGDLWAGNRLVDRAGRNWLIDPAAFAGHREFDLAMMLLFGGFGPDAFAAYNEVAPLADGWRDRVPLHQLAPLIVHAIKFGGGYRQATDEAVAYYR
jgi:fructosamine-3-kinase